MSYIFILIIIVIIFYLFKSKIKIKFLTFLQEGYLKKSSPYGVYCYVGKQGKGKTQAAYSFLLENKNKRIYANMKSIKGIHYKYFNGLDELLKLRNESDCIIFYDEIFKIMTKGTKFNEDIMDFLSQMRKRNIIFITTAQEWLEIPITLRRYCRFMIDCNIISILGYPIIIKKFGDAENMKWDNLENEYVCPALEKVIEHGRKKIVDGYDTYEQIGSESISPIDMYNPLSENVQPLKADIFLDATCSRQENAGSELLSTTTISNSPVNGQFTEKSALFDTSQNLDFEFWTDISTDDFTLDEEQNY